MSSYMGRTESADAIAQALEIIRKYPHQWICYNPNDPLANSVVAYLRKEGKIVVNRFNSFKAAPKYKVNPSKRKGAPGIAERSAKLHKIRKQFVKDLKAAKKNGNRIREDYMIRKINKLDRILFAQPGNTMRAKYKKNPVSKFNRYHRLHNVAVAAYDKFVRAVKKQFPRERAGDALYKSNRFNPVTKKAFERSRKATEALLKHVGK